MSVRVYLETNFTPDIAEEIVPLYRALHMETLGQELPGLNTDFLRDAVITDMLRVVLVRDDTKLVGFMLAYQGVSITGKKQITITQIYMDPAYRGRKTEHERSPAAKMVELIQTLALGAKAVVSIVARGERAIKFYVALGATPVELVLEFNNV